MRSMKRLYRSETNKIIGGVLGGIGEYFDIDPVIVRLLYIIGVLLTAIIPGVIVYILALFIIPKPVARIIEVEEVDHE